MHLFRDSCALSKEIHVNYLLTDMLQNIILPINVSTKWN